jgi:RPA family protein
MSDADQSGAGRREVAYRLFATEFEDADRSYSESDEERAPNYVVTPTGARINRLFVVGVLTEVEQVSDDVLRGRVVDPTGAFVIYAGQYQPDEMAFLETADPPMFVAVTGKARTFQPDDSDRVFTSIRPESINEVDADTRDRWTVQAAEQTLDRIAHMARALGRDERGEDLRTVLEDQGIDEGLAAGIPIAIDHYETGPAYLDALRETARDAARVVAGTGDEVSPPEIAPDEAGDARLEPLRSAGVDVAPIAGQGESDSASGSSSSAGGESTADTSTTTAEATADTATPTDSEDTATTESEEPTVTESEEPKSSEATTADSEDSDMGTTGSDQADESVADSGEEADDLGDFDPAEYELEDETREQIEEEYGTEFQTGTEVEEPGSADIETSEPESPDEAESTPASEPESTAGEAGATDTEPANSEPPETTESPEASEQTPEPDETAEPEDAEQTAEPDDLQGAVVDLMSELDDGDGADRDAVIEEMQTRYGTDAEATEAAIQDALMDGECYEPDEQTLKPI